MFKRRVGRPSLVVLAVMFGTFLVSGGALGGDLEHDFATPPESAKAAAYWWWLNNNVSAPSKTEISELDNPTWPKANHRASTELCAGEGN